MLPFTFAMENRGDRPAYTFGAIYRYACSGCGTRSNSDWCFRCMTDESTYEPERGDWGEFTARRYRISKRRTA